MLHEVELRIDADIDEDRLKNILKGVAAVVHTNLEVDHGIVDVVVSADTHKEAGVVRLKYKVAAVAVAKEPVTT